MAPIPPVSAARSVSARMRSLSWTAKLRRRGRADNSGDAAAGAGTTVGLRPPFAPSPAAASICLGSMGMTYDPSAPPSLNSRGKMSHLHWHGGICVGLENTGVLLQVALRMLAGAIARVIEHRCRRRRATKRSVVADV